MIDFQNGSLIKLSEDQGDKGYYMVEPMLVSGEEVFAEFSSVRDRVVFTNKRIISINVQGITGAKKDFTSLPYSKIQAFSIETSGTLGLDSELELYYSGLGKVRFEFRGNFDIVTFNQCISKYIL